MKDQPPASTALHVLGTVVLAVAASAVVVAGARHLAFVCDDAYIAFRYVHNWLAGDGLVWNPAPFRPVEGYTSPLWVVLLGAVWRATGVQPPQASNLLLLVFSVGSIGWTAWMAHRMPLGRRLTRWRPAVVGVVLLGTCTNLTFLTWSTSGLEQGMFTFWLLGWLALATTVQPRRGTLFLLSCLAALLALTRPDGLLYVGMTGVMIAAFNLLRVWGGRWSPLDLPAAVPLLAIPAHLLWRLQTYGEWLPNTYYAKAVAPWPLMGGAYLGGFILEFAFFAWIPLAFLAWHASRNGAREPRPVPRAADWMKLLAWTALGGHLAYYTLIIGGDHFEFRIYHHLVPLLMLALVWLVDRIRLPAGLALGVATWCVLAGWILPWTHHYKLNDHVAAQARGWDPHDVAPHLPLPLQPWGLLWDLDQDYMRGHFVGHRRRGHVNVMKKQRRRYPNREQGLALDLPEGDIAVHRAATVGYPGWVLPDVAVIDALGLNDWVIARGETRKRRKMAHDRIAPPGYVDCFRPNVTARRGFKVLPRSEPLTPEQVRACEARFAEQVTSD